MQDDNEFRITAAMWDSLTSKVDEMHQVLLENQKAYREWAARPIRRSILRQLLVAVGFLAY
jgi:hypothetical protein